MSMTVNQLEAIREAIIRDIALVSVQEGDRSVTYVADKKKALDAINAEIAKVNGASGRTSCTYASFSKG